MARPPLQQRFAAQLAGTGLLRPGQHVLVALSGGTDSLALLHLLRFGAPVSGLRVSAAHFDHAMRPDSAADADWVRGVCRSWGVPLQEARATVPLRGESAARAARYAFLDECAARVGADRIATGHQQDDQAETVLFRIARGTGTAGLAGIPARRGAVVRPLLAFSRAEIVAYARAVRLRPREDPSNRSLAFARNRIRHRLLPALERARPGAAARLARIAELAGLLQAAWRGLVPGLAAGAVVERAEGRIVLARGVLLGYDPPSRARVMRYCARQLGAPLSRGATRAALALVGDAQSGRVATVAGGLRIEREFDRIILDRPVRSAQRAGDRPLSIAGPTTGAGNVVLGGVRWQVRWAPGPGDPGSEGFDAAAMAFPLELRAWRHGDRIRLPYGAKKLKKLFAERRIGRTARGSVPVLAEQGGTGRVLWVAGVARATCARAREGRPAWHITVEHEQHD